jgi:F420-dependent oxidoreductase-like protein
MRVCLMIEGQDGVTWEEWVALARACDASGIEGLFRSDHYSGLSGVDRTALDAWATLAALAACTDTIRLGSMVSPAAFRHPSVLARMAATIDHVSGGRVEVGIGTGWHEEEHRRNGFPFPDARTRFAVLAEQVEILVRSWTEEEWDFDGEHYRLERQTALPRPVQQPHPPLLLGGTVRPGLARLAAAWATEVNTFLADPGQCAARRQALDEACAAAGRDPATLPLSLMTICVLGEDHIEVRDRLRRSLGLQGDSRDVDAVLAGPDAEWLVGTVDQVAERLGAFASAGVERVMLKHVDHRDVDMVRLIGERLVPAVAGPR